MNTTHTGIAVALAVAVVIGFFWFGTTLPNQSQETLATDTSTGTSTNSTSLPMDLSLNPEEALPTELVATDIVVGTGAEAVPGSTVTVNYVGALPDGTVFDASAKHGQAFSFPLGAGRVIRGWDEGVAGMKVGGKRRLIIPPHLAYGAQGAGDVIPPNATLVFEVELLAVQ